MGDRGIRTTQSSAARPRRVEAFLCGNMGGTDLTLPRQNGAIALYYPGDPQFGLVLGRRCSIEAVLPSGLCKHNSGGVIVVPCLLGVTPRSWDLFRSKFFFYQTF